MSVITENMMTATVADMTGKDMMNAEVMTNISKADEELASVVGILLVKVTESLCRMPRGLPRGMNACLAQRVIRETGRLPYPQRPLRSVI